MKSLPSWLASGTGDIPLVMLHGMGSTAEIWLPQLNHFGSTRLAVAWTAPGYGNSPALSQLGWDTLSASLDEMLVALGAKQIHLLGHSIGGMVAQDFYHRYPHRVASLILSASSAGFGGADPKWGDDFIQQRTEPLARYSSFAEAAPTLLDGFMGPATSSAMRQLAYFAAAQISRDEYLRHMRLLVTFDRKSDLARISVPTLLLAGQLDTQAPPKGMQRMAEQIPGARLHIFPATKHMANIERPEEFNHVVAQFLATLPIAANF